MNLGDFAIGQTIDLKFTTRRFSTGVPFTLAGSPAVAAYADNVTAEITAGVTLSVDFDGRTGLNNVRVVATTGNGYAAGSSYALVITAGTVDGVSVVGEVVGYFTLDRTRLAAIQAKTDTIGSGTVTVTSPVASAHEIELVRGDDYYAADGRSLDFTFTSFPSFVGATPVTLTLRNRNTGVEDLTITGSALGATQLRFELTSAQTANLGVGTSAYDFDIQVTLSNGHKVTVNIGSATVLEDFS